MLLPKFIVIKRFIYILIVCYVNFLLQVATSTNGLNQLHKSPCPYAIKMDTNYHYRGSLHFICLQSTLSYPTLEVIQFSHPKHQLIARFQVDDLGTNQMASFVDDEGTLRVLLATPDRENGTSVYSIDKLGQVLKETHTVNNQFVSAISVWRLQLDWQWKVAIANQPTYEQHINLNKPPPRSSPSSSSSSSHLLDPKPMITIHSWRSTYFDSDQLIRLPQEGRVNRIEPLNINGQEFLIVAMDNQHHGTATINHQANYAGGSFIYKLDFGDGSLNWNHFQTLPTKLALDIRSFSISHKDSIQKDYYFALLGQLAPINSIRSATNKQQQQHQFATTSFNDELEYGLKIFKYFGNQFVRTHSLSIPAATKLDTITYGTGDSYVFIALLSGATGQVSLYLFDGLTLRVVNNSPPTLSSANLPNLSGPQTVHRRTLNSADLHLFLAPSTTVQELATTDGSAGNSNGTSKRTLPVETTDQSAPLPLPVLALSQAQTTTTTTTNAVRDDELKSLYHIPAEELLKEESELEKNGNQSKRNFIVQGGLDLLNWCHASINRLVKDNFDDMSKQLLALPRIDQNRPIEISGGDLVIEDDLHVSNLLLAANVMDTSGIPVYLGNTNFSNTFNGIQVAHFEIDQLKRDVDRILVDDGTPQDVYNPVSFDKLIVECISNNKFDPREHIMFQPTISCPYISEITTGLLNSRNITNLAAQALMTGRSMVINGDVRFEHLVLRGQTEILGFINNISIGDIVFKRQTSVGAIDGHKIFQKPIFSSSHLSVERWNGFEVNSNNYLTSTDYQRIEAQYDVGQVIIDSNEGFNNKSFIGQLNNINLQMHLNQIALSSEVNEILQPIYCDELILNGPVNFLGTLITGVDVHQLWFRTMFKHSVQDVPAHMNFLGSVHVSYGGDMDINGPINGIFIQPNSVLMRDRNYTLGTPIFFEHDVSASRIHLERSLNDIPVVTNNFTGVPELAILYDGGQQTLDGYKILNNVSLAGSTSIMGTINGHLNLTNLYSLLDDRRAYRFSTIHLAGTSVKVAKQAHIKIEYINDISANQLCDIATQLTNNTIHTEYEGMKFEQPIHFKKLRCTTINGFNDLSNTFLTRYGNQHVQGTIKLTNGVIFNTTLNIHSTINNINVTPLAGAIARTLNESRTRHKNIRGDLIVDDLIVDRINDLHSSNVFLAKSDLTQVIRAPMTFDHLDIENVLRIGKNMVTSSFNNLNITDILTNTLQYDAPQVIHSPLQLNTLQLLPDSNFMTSTLNGIDIQRLFSDAVLIDVPQQILAPKTFTGQVDLNNRLSLRHGLDGLTEDELKYNLILQTDELIEGDLEIYTQVTVKKELEILSGLINDLDINLFVNSMLYENPLNKTGGLKILGNGSITFKDVKLNNLVVGGTIQGIDLSRDALLSRDNQNGSYNARIREQQAFLNNQRLLDNLYGSTTQLRVRNQYRGSNYSGSCFIHSCSRIVSPPMTQIPTYDNIGIKNVWKPNWNQGLQTPPQQFQQQHHQPQPPQMFQVPQPIQTTHYVNTGRNLSRPQEPIRNLISTNRNMNLNNHPVDISNHYLDLHEHLLKAKAQAISDLSSRVNKYLSIAFYYEIVQKQPLFGPLMHASSNPNPNERSGSFLFLKATGKPGEPCLRRGQQIAVMSQQRYKKGTTGFAQGSRIQDTSDPRAMDSVIVGKNSYLFILDAPAEDKLEFASQLFIYSWDQHLGLYNLRGRISIEGFPTSMKAFAVNDIACVAIANPGVLFGNYSGAITLYCQTYPASLFEQRITLPITNAFELDAIPLPGTNSVIIGALCQQDTEQVGDLRVISFNVLSRTMKEILVRRTVKPLKLHFFKSFTNSTSIQLVVSEAITGNDGALATTRIFSLHFLPSHYSELANVTIFETQTFKDNQIFDIQTVKLNRDYSMLFMRSVNSISIYVPESVGSYQEDCDVHYSLVQRLPTKGANKFLVFNDEQFNNDNNIAKRPYDHFLILSKDDCELHKYATLILKAKFKM